MLRLVERLWRAEDTFVVHYDRRSKRSEHAELRAALSRRENVFFQKPRCVLWARYSLAAAQLEGIKIALESGRDWSHWINLSGQCYPGVLVR